MGWRPFLVLLLVVGALALAMPAAAGTPPALAWNVTLGGSGSDGAAAVNETSDGGYIVAGQTSSSDSDVGFNHGVRDAWVVQLDPAGQPAWNTTLGGSGDDYATAVLQSADGGYVAVGSTNSNDGVLGPTHGGYDCWVAKLDGTGQVAWNATLGGTLDDGATAVTQAADGGYVVAGFTDSHDSEAGWLSDAWVAKLDADGRVAWTATLGGSGFDQASAVDQEYGGGFVVAGQASSSDGDIPRNQGGYDAWVARLDADGTLVGMMTLGGSLADGAAAVRQASDGGYVVAGYTLSNDGDVGFNHGGQDGWVVKLDADGGIAWNRTLGGSGSDGVYAVDQAFDGGFVVAGSTTSSDGDVAGNRGGYDCWAVKLDADGGMAWNATLGGSLGDGASAVRQASDGGYVVAGSTSSADGDPGFTRGDYDSWVVKLAPDGPAVPWAPGALGAPLAAFSGTPTVGFAPLAVAFAHESSGSPTSWSWDFDGDGVTDSTDRYPFYVYPAAGTYTVTLNVVGEAGGSFVTRTGYITVADAPGAPVAGFGR